jgi:hypothetical protein
MLLWKTSYLPLPCCACILPNTLLVMLTVPVLVTVVPIVVITDTQWKDWRTPGHADENLIITEKVEDVETVLVTQRVKLPCVTTLDKKTYETVTKILIQTAHTLLIKTLYNTCDKQNGFKTFATNPAYITYKIEFDIIAKAIRVP